MFIPIFKYDPVWAYDLNIIFHAILLEFCIFFYSNFLFNNKKIAFLISVLVPFSGAFIAYTDYKPFNNSFPQVILSLYNIHLFMFKIINEGKDYLKNLFFIALF